jgi:glycyl-tRNA synthetase alpha subunit
MARRTYQDIILALERYWADYGCTLMTPYHTEVAAGTMNPATLLRSLGPRLRSSVAGFIVPAATSVWYGVIIVHP